MAEGLLYSCVDVLYTSASAAFGVSYCHSSLQPSGFVDTAMSCSSPVAVMLDTAARYCPLYLLQEIVL